MSHELAKFSTRDAYSEQMRRNDALVMSIALDCAAALVAGCSTVAEAAACLEREANRVRRISGDTEVRTHWMADAEYLSWFPVPADEEYRSWGIAA